MQGGVRHGLLVLLHGNAQMLRHLPVRGNPARDIVELRHGLLNALGPLAHGAGHPVLLAGQIHNHPPDALGDIHLKAPLAGVELFHRVGQDNQALVYDIIQLGKTAKDAPNL